MKNFKNWLTESSLRKQLEVPQKPQHHPEGDVDRHTMMVWSSLKPAIEILKQKQNQDPTGPLSELDLNFTKEDLKLLRFAGLLHDIGKGDALDPETLSAHGHENPETFEKAMHRLSPIWHKIHDQANPKDKDDLWWVIKHHMSLKDKEGFQNKTLKKELLDDKGKYKTDRKVKLLLTLLLMDRMGRGGQADFPWQQAKEFAKNNAEGAHKGLKGIYTTSDLYRDEIEKRDAKASTSIGDDPKTVVTNLKLKGKTKEQIRMALQGMAKNGKFQLSPKDIDDLLQESTMSFRHFIESNEDQPATMKASIPLGVFEKGATTLSNLFKDAGYTIYIVGGTGRDYLMSKLHDVPFDIKDVDFATNALTPNVIQVLKDADIKYIAKGEAFGVISAILDHQEFEIATFREESGYEDKRRPSQVKPSDAKNDYRRRDFTFNALYYDMPRSPGGMGTIIDYGGGKGFQDIKNKKVSTVGSPDDRFAEDPLRVLRGVRFHGIFNKENLKDIVDPETLKAMKKFSSLEGVSPERIQAEFVAALTKARDPKVVLNGFESIGALPYMFPGLKLDMNAVNNLDNLPNVIKDKKKHNIKKVILTLALLLRNAGSPDEIRKKLNKLNWPNDVTDEVANLMQTLIVTKNPTPETMSKHAINLLKKNTDLRKELVNDLHPILGHEVDPEHLQHLGIYQPAKFSGEEIQKQLGLHKMGPEIGARIKDLQSADYQNSFNRWKKTNKENNK